MEKGAVAKFSLLFWQLSAINNDNKEYPVKWAAIQQKLKLHPTSNVIHFRSFVASAKPLLK
jgi:hypothetical protein